MTPDKLMTLIEAGEIAYSRTSDSESEFERLRDIEKAAEELKTAGRISDYTVDRSKGKTSHGAPLSILIRP